jgi:cytoskeletal protein CcmA (bactofilin family)
MVAIGHLLPPTVSKLVRAGKDERPREIAGGFRVALGGRLPVADGWATTAAAPAPGEGGRKKDGTGGVGARAIVLLIALWLGAAQAPPVHGEERRLVAEDQFIAGRSVEVIHDVAGDLFLAGGWVDVASKIGDNLIALGGVLDVTGNVGGDMLAAGGMVDVAASVVDSLVLAGGVVSVSGRIDGKLFAAAGRLRVARNARIAGNAWIVAASTDISGTIGGNTVISGARTILRGHFRGDVEVTSLSLTVAPGARISGRLTHYGPDPAQIADEAAIEGGFEQRFEPPAEEPPEEGTGWPPFFWLLITLGLGLILDHALPRFVGSASERTLDYPLANFALGLAILFVTPVMIVLLIVSVLGFAIGIAAIAAYGTLLLLGPVVALFAAADLAGRVRPSWVATPLRRRLLFVAALVLITLIARIPYVGTPTFWIVTLLGLGAATWQVYESLRSERGPRRAPRAVEDASE